MSNEKISQGEDLSGGATAPLPLDHQPTAWHRGAGKPARSGPPGNRNAEKHGIHRLKAVVKELGSRAIDKRTHVGRALAAWRAELIADLGGIENISTQELALVEEAVKTKLILDSVDAWVLSQSSLIDKRKRTVFPVVRDRSALVSTLRQLLGDLGLRRRGVEALDLGAYLATRTQHVGDEGCHVAEERHAQSVDYFAADGPLPAGDAGEVES